MELQNEFCAVRIGVDSTYTVDSADNRHYDVIWNPENYKQHDFYKTFAIHIDQFSGELTVALVGDFYSFETDCALLDGKVLTVLQNDAISQIDVRTGQLLLHKSFDCLGCNYGLYRVPGGYLVYGEIEIVMLDLNFDRKWAFSGRDVFVSYARKKPYTLDEQTIRLQDWEGNCYELNLDGELIGEGSAQ